jgi:hypothetical protein
MKKIALFAAVLFCAMASQLSATDKTRADERCSNADLRGVYSFVADGYLGGDAFATAGQTTYDGRGGASGLIQISTNGAVTPRLNWSGTYAVDAATCTATKTVVLPNGSVDFFVTFADGFKELRFISTTEGATISGSARKQ